MPNEGSRLEQAAGARKRLACVVLALLAALAISACSALRLGYDVVPWYASWQLDRYWGLDSEQAGHMQERVEQLLRWHRRSELPEYSRWLRRVNERLQSPIDLAEATSWRRTMTEFWDRTIRRLGPDLTEVLLGLRPEQIERMKRRMESENEDYIKEFLPEDQVERQERRVKRIERRIEYYLGEIGSGQREIVRRMARSMPQNEEIWFRERLARQQEFLELLARLSRWGRTASQEQRLEAQRQVIAYLAALWQPVDSRRASSLESVMRASDEITVAVLNSATPRQKARLSRRLLGWAEDLDALAR